jgi:hypothetical protein
MSLSTIFPETKTLIRDGFKPVFAFFIALVNLALVYVSLYDPYIEFFAKMNQPYNIPVESAYYRLIDYGIILALLISTIIVLYQLFAKQKIFYGAALFAAVVIAAIWVAEDRQTYPNSSFQSEKEGHLYKTEIWWGRPDGKRIYKRWKSIEPYNSQMDPDLVNYSLDSLSISLDKS